MEAMSYMLGVTLWEIMTEAQLPWARMPDAQVLPTVRKGLVLERPSHCPLEFYQVVKKKRRRKEKKKKRKKGTKEDEKRTNARSNEATKKKKKLWW